MKLQVQNRGKDELGRAERTQQSTLPTNTSPLQDDPIGRLFVMFTSSPRALAAAEIDAIIRKIQGDPNMTKTQLAKTVMIYHLIIPMLFQWVADGFDLTRNQYRAFILGPFNAIPVFKDVMEAVVAELVGSDSYQFNMFADTLVDDLIEIIGDFGDDDVDMLEILEASAELAGFIGGVPVKSAIGIAQGVPALAEGELDEAGLLFLGFTPSQVEKRTED